MKARRIIAASAILLIVLVVALTAFASTVLAFSRDKLFNLYMSRLDAWVHDGGKVDAIQSQVVESCGKLIVTQAGAWERLQLLTFYRDEFDFRADVCTKMTTNRLYKQPEFEKPEIVKMICDNTDWYHEIFRRLCRRSGLRPAG
jgi:hypothetical protein